jgi:hypothetical protein
VCLLLLLLHAVQGDQLHLLVRFAPRFASHPSRPQTALHKWVWQAGRGMLAWTEVTDSPYEIFEFLSQRVD